MTLKTYEENNKFTKDQILFYNSFFQSPFVFCSRIKVPNKNNQFLWAVNRKDFVWCFDKIKQTYDWFTHDLALTNNNPVYGSHRLDCSFDTYEEAMVFFTKIFKI